MSNPRKPSLILPVAVTLLLLAGYVGSYYAMVVPVYDLVLMNGSGESFPIYRMRGEYYEGRVAQFFAPMHRIDRRLRTQVWSPSRRDLQRRLDALPRIR